MSAGTERKEQDQRHLDWEGCFNVRDLGGLPAKGGRRTRWGAVVRADALDGLTQAGWRALTEHGVRTVIDLRNDDELGVDVAPRPRHVTTIHCDASCRSEAPRPKLSSSSCSPSSTSRHTFVRPG
jgi:protein tyrosine/serine phosphatase